jgi:hypothetical protein
MEGKLQLLVLRRATLVGEEAVDPSRFPIGARSLYRFRQHFLDLLTRKRRFIFALLLPEFRKLNEPHGTIGLRVEDTGGKPIYVGLRREVSDDLT